MGGQIRTEMGDNNHQALFRGIRGIACEIACIFCICSVLFRKPRYSNLDSTPTYVSVNDATVSNGSVLNESQTFGIFKITPVWFLFRGFICMLVLALVERVGTHLRLLRDQPRSSSSTDALE